MLIVCSSAGRVPEGTQLLLDCLQSGDQTGLPRLPLLALFVERTVAFQLSPQQQVLSRRTVPLLFFSESSPLFRELLLNLPQAPLVVSGRCPQSLDLEGCLGLSAVAIRLLPQSSRPSALVSARWARCAASSAALAVSASLRSSSLRLRSWSRAAARSRSISRDASASPPWPSVSSPSRRVSSSPPLWSLRAGLVALRLPPLSQFPPVSAPVHSFDPSAPLLHASPPPAVAESSSPQDSPPADAGSPPPSGGSPTADCPLSSAAPPSLAARFR